MFLIDRIVDRIPLKRSFGAVGYEHSEKEDSSSVSVLFSSRQSWRRPFNFKQVIYSYRFVFFTIRMANYLMADLVDQSTKDYALLQNQRSSHNIGVVVGNMLGGLFKKGVDLVNEFEEQIQKSFVIESRN